MVASVFDLVENNVGKGENAGYQKLSVQESLKFGTVW